MKRYLMFLLLALALVCPACADVYSDLSPGIVSVVADAPVPLRTAPGESAQAVMQLSSGVSLTLLSVDDTGWAYVQTCSAEGDALRGYVPAHTLLNGDYLYRDLYCVVNPEKEQRLNLRSGPASTAPSLGKYYTGVLVQSLGQEQNGYLRVCVGSSVGYMDRRYLLPWSAASASAIPAAEVQSQSPLGAWLYTQPSLSGERSARYPNGTKAAVLGMVSEDWCHVMIRGVTGFLKIGDMDPVPPYRYPTEQATGGSSALHGWNGPVGQHSIAPWSVVMDEYTAVVSNPSPADRLHLRARPDEHSASLGKYYNGVRVVINGDPSGEWVSVTVGGSLHGYMKTEFLKTDGTAVPSAMPVMHVVSPDPAAQVHLRESRSNQSRSLGICAGGTEAILMGFSRQWAHVIVDGRFGFLPAGCLQ